MKEGYLANLTLSKVEKSVKPRYSSLSQKNVAR